MISKQNSFITADLSNKKIEIVSLLVQKWQNKSTHGLNSTKLYTVDPFLFRFEVKKKGKKLFRRKLRYAWWNCLKTWPWHSSGWPRDASLEVARGLGPPRGKRTKYYYTPMRSTAVREVSTIGAKVQKLVRALPLFSGNCAIRLCIFISEINSYVQLRFFLKKISSKTFIQSVTELCTWA